MPPRTWERATCLSSIILILIINGIDLTLTFAFSSTSLIRPTSTSRAFHRDQSTVASTILAARITNDDNDDEQQQSWESTYKTGGTLTEESRNGNVFKISEDYAVTSINELRRSSLPPQRTIAKLEKFARLPVWPVWNGVIIFFLSQIFGAKFGAQLEDYFGGRVCPNFFNSSPSGQETSPFVMLVHHRHSFAIGDPLRWFQTTFFPEGFPSHPHRGFTTVTYCLKGGFIHRDSLGLRQTYGAQPQHGGKHTQWLNTGAGMLHEEMWDNANEEWWKPVDQELYQIWLNVPGAMKLRDPSVELLGGADSTPTVIVADDQDRKTQTIVLCGTYRDGAGSVQPFSDVSILHVTAEPGSVWRYSIPESHETAILYMRKGCGTMDGSAIPTHHTAYLSSTGREIVVEARNEDGTPSEADFMVLSGAPLREPVAAQGSMVMNTDYEIQQAYADYESMKMGAPWSQNLTDEEWMEHVRKFPSIYKETHYGS